MNGSTCAAIAFGMALGTAAYALHAPLWVGIAVASNMAYVAKKVLE